MSKEKRPYISFLLRLWQAESKGDLVWWASLESSRTEERWGFASLDELFAFLRQQTTEASNLSTGIEEASRQGERGHD